MMIRAYFILLFNIFFVRDIFFLINIEVVSPLGKVSENFSQFTRHLPNIAHISKLRLARACEEKTDELKKKLIRFVLIYAWWFIFTSAPKIFLRSCDL